jgi:hypothetical protein
MNLRDYVWLAVAAVLAAGAFFAGRELRGDAGASFDYELQAPPYEAAVSAIGLSKGGFSGFEAGSNLDDETIISGRVVNAAGTSLTLESAAGITSTLRITGERPLRRIEPATVDALRPGTTIIARGDQAGAIAAVLIVATP